MLLRLQESESHVQMDLQQHKQLVTLLETLSLEAHTSSSKVLAEPVSLRMNSTRKHVHAQTSSVPQIQNLRKL